MKKSKITKQTVIAYFKSDRYVEDKTSKVSSRYTCLVFPGAINKIYVGKKGAIFYGKTFLEAKNDTDFYKEDILDWMAENENY